MTLAINKRINIELSIVRTAALYIVNGRIKKMVSVVNNWYWFIRGSTMQYAKDAGMRNKRWPVLK